MSLNSFFFVNNCIGLNSSLANSCNFVCEEASPLKENTYDQHDLLKRALFTVKFDRVAFDKKRD